MFFIGGWKYRSDTRFAAIHPRTGDGGDAVITGDPVVSVCGLVTEGRAGRAIRDSAIRTDTPHPKQFPA